MKKLLLLTLLSACASTPREPAPNIHPAGEINGQTLYTLISPTDDHNDPVPVTKFDQREIMRSGLCKRGFYEVKVEYGPLSPDGISSKYLTFYCS